MKEQGHHINALPMIIVLSSDGDDTFRWMSDGWGGNKNLLQKAHAIIAKAVDHADAIMKLHKAGFGIRRTHGEDEGG